MNVIFFFQAEDGIRDIGVTGVQTCALPIFLLAGGGTGLGAVLSRGTAGRPVARAVVTAAATEIRRAAGRGRGEILGGGVSLKKKIGISPAQLFAPIVLCIPTASAIPLHFS